MLIKFLFTLSLIFSFALISCEGKERKDIIKVTPGNLFRNSEDLIVLKRKASGGISQVTEISKGVSFPMEIGIPEDTKKEIEEILPAVLID